VKLINYISQTTKDYFMKAPKIILTSLAVAVSAAVFSQETVKPADTSVKEKVSTWGIYPAPQKETAGRDQAFQSDSNRQTLPAPNFGNYYIPVLGIYNAAEGSAEKNIVIAGDEKNPGKVWIEGLSNERIYALLKEAPGTYKIPAQKNAKEGTLIYDDESKEVSICVGCGYKDNDPANTIATNQSGKKKSGKTVLSFTGTKTDHSTVSSQ
jgi:hypothetical protein